MADFLLRRNLFQGWVWKSSATWAFFAYGMFSSTVGDTFLFVVAQVSLQHFWHFHICFIPRFLSSETSGLHPILQRHLMCSVDGAAHCLAVVAVLAVSAAVAGFKAFKKTSICVLKTGKWSYIWLENLLQADQLSWEERTISCQSLMVPHLSQTSWVLLGDSAGGAWKNAAAAPVFEFDESDVMWVEQCHVYHHLPSPSHHHFYRWYGYHSQSSGG